MASPEINKLKARFESSSSSNGGSPRPPARPYPPPSLHKPATSSPEMKKKPAIAVGGGGSVKVKPLTPPSAKYPAGKSDTLPSAKVQVGTPPTTKAEAASHLSFVLKGKVRVGGEGETAAKVGSGVESKRSNQGSVNGMSSSVSPSLKAPIKASNGAAKPALPKGNKPISPPPKDKPPLLPPSASSSKNVKSVFGVTLSHREKESGPHSPVTAKVKPLQPPALRDVKPRPPSSVHSGGSGTGEGSAERGNRNERATSVPRDIEMSGSEDVHVPPKKPKTPPMKRLSVNEQDLKSRSTSDLSKPKDTGSRQSYKPRPPPKKPGILGDKPSLLPKPAGVNRSPSRVPPKSPIGNLKNTQDFSRARRGSSPSSRETTPTRDTPTPTGYEQKSRSKSFTPLEGSMEDTLKCPVNSARPHSDSESWVVIGEGGKEESKTPPTKGSPLMSKRRAPPQVPQRVRSPEASLIDGSKSPSVNALRSKFGDPSSPPTSPSARTVTPPKRVAESKFDSVREKFSSPSPAVVVQEAEPSVGTPPSSVGSGRSNADSGFISEVPDDVSTVGQATSNENISEELETPSTPLSPDSHETEEKPVEEEIWDEARLEKARMKRSKIAQELVDTEKTYVTRLKLVAEDFYDVVKPYAEKGKGLVTESDVTQIFLNIQQIHQLNQTILQSLETRIDSWSDDERLGDVICRLAPFLKLYSHYTSGFEDAMKTLTECTKRDKKFDTMVRDFERTTISTGLGVAHYMLEPIQRIPRYRLLLVDYLKYLPPGSPDRPDTEKALGIISEAADRNNDRIKELEISNEILSIQRSLSEYNGMLLQPSRVFMKKGVLQKMSRKNLTQRMFFLFSDVLIHTYPAHNGVYKFKDEMALCEMHIATPTVSLFPHSFEVHCTSRSLLLVAASEEEKLEWMDSLDSAINDDIRKRRSLRRNTFVAKRSQMKKFGYKAPIMVPDKSVSMCQVCSTEFTVLFRRHHCRACGKVVCSNCSQKKAYLQYLKKDERICEACYEEYRKEMNEGSTSIDEIDAAKTGSPKTPKKQDSAPGVLNLKAYDQDAVIAGYVMSQEGRKFNRVWYQVRQDCVLYKFRAHEDIKAYHSLPLPGYMVKPNDNSSTIQLVHPSKKKELGDTFKVEDATAFNNWKNTLEKVVRMEIPSPAHQPKPACRLSQSLEDSLSVETPSPRQQQPAHFNFNNSDTHSQRDSFESFSSGSFREGSPEVEQPQT